MRWIAAKLGRSRDKVEHAGSTNERNVLLTGPGRSGTTLTCHLLNKLPNTVALAEPLSPRRFEAQMPDHEAICDELEKIYGRMRRRALKDGLVRSKHVGGVVPDNTKGHVGGVRKRIAEKGLIPVGKELDEGFVLAIKQPGMFTAMLPFLTGRFPCYAIVRNPLAIIASSSSIQSKKRGGNPSSRMRYDPDYRLRVEQDGGSGADGLAPELQSLHYGFERYRRALPPENVIRYEDICDSGGKALRVITPAADALDEPLENKNLNPLYAREKVLRVGERLLRSEGAYWDFYSRESVQEIMDGLG